MGPAVPAGWQANIAAPSGRLIGGTMPADEYNENRLPQVTTTVSADRPLAIITWRLVCILQRGPPLARDFVGEY